MSNSELVDYIKISPNKTKNRRHIIDTITIHMTAGQGSVETIGSIFSNPSRKASSNYGIGSDGRIGLYVDENDRSWCSSSDSNDHRAITIETASDSKKPYTVNAAAYKSLIRLVADVCKRNGIPKLLWKNDKSLIGNVSLQNMTVHKWFADTSCPGDYLLEKMNDIAERVNRILNGEDEDSVLYDIDNEERRDFKTVNIEMKVLKKGMKDSQVMTLQRILDSLGYRDNNGNRLVIDGSFGGKTDFAIREFQKKEGLAVDGSCGAKTWNKLLH